MNPYFHQFSIGFNTWYVVAPALLVVAIIISSVLDVRFYRYRSRRLGGAKAIRYERKATGMASDISRIVFGILAVAVVSRLIFVESYAGIQQVCDNVLLRAGDTDAIYSALTAGFVWIGMTIAYAVAMFFATAAGYYVTAVFAAIINAVVVLTHPVSQPHRRPTRAQRRVSTR